ncbi:diacylglycerol kinase [Hoeflea poritis]|uniref:Diacylglycerol kinase n=1 Tax=Hoeflea poritis TaxID=2993659 RepID=A0ABT4VHZ0_9HYPH|nr:diacylglycerol kinase [Hoeflea poritis]MDA4844310.1 diacylglycerol kinase [Hoeflea poritis]
MNRILNAFRNSWNGLSHVIRNEAAFRQEAAIFLVSLPVAYFLADSVFVFLLLTGSLVIVLTTELMNTGLEALCDALSRETRDEIRIAKDCGSAAVALTITLAGVIWLSVIAQKFGLLPLP